MEVFHARARFGLSVTAAHSAARFTAHIATLSRNSELQPRFDLSVSGSLASAYRGDALHYGVRVLVGGVEIPASSLMPPCSVQLQRHGLHTFAFTVAISETGTSPVGRLADGVCGLLQGADVDIYSRIYGSGGVRDVLLLSGAVERETIEERDPPSITISGTGRGGRWDQNVTSLQMARGTLNSRGTAALRLLVAAGVPSSSVSISAGRAMAKSVDVAEENVYPSVNDLLYPEVRALHHQPDTGVISTLPLGKLPGSPRWTFTASEILRSGLSNKGPSAVQGPSVFVVRGSRQIVDEDCSAVTTVETTTTFANLFVVPSYVARYDSAGAVVLSGITNGPRVDGNPTPISRIVSTVTRVCGTEVSRVEEEYAWYQGPRVWKARLNTDGTVESVNTSGRMYSTPGATPVGGSEIDPTPMRAWPQARFTLIRRTRSDSVFSRDGHPADLKLSGGDPGLLIRTRQRVEEWHHIETALKSKLSTDKTPWEETPYISLVKVLADGHGSHYGEERFGRFVSEEFGDSGAPLTVFGGVEAVDTEIRSQDGKTIATTAEYRAWGAWPGNSGGSVFLFSGNVTQNVEVQTFRHHQSVSVVYVENGEDGHDEITTESDQFTRSSSLDSNPSEVKRGVQSSLPSTPLMAGLPTGEATVSADPSQAQEMEVRYGMNLVLNPSCRSNQEQVIEVAYAEDESELQAVAEYESSQSLARTINCPLRLMPGVGFQPVDISDDPFISATIHPETISHELLPASGVPTTTITGKSYAE